MRLISNNQWEEYNHLKKRYNKLSKAIDSSPEITCCDETMKNRIKTDPYFHSLFQMYHNLKNTLIKK